MPMKDIEVVLLKHGQQIEDGLNREKPSARVEHEAPVRVEIGLHFVWISNETELRS